MGPAELSPRNPAIHSHAFTRNLIFGTFVLFVCFCTCWYFFVVCWYFWFCLVRWGLLWNWAHETPRFILMHSPAIWLLVHFCTFLYLLVFLGSVWWVGAHGVHPVHETLRFIPCIHQQSAFQKSSLLFISMPTTSSISLLSLSLSTSKRKQRSNKLTVFQCN